MELAKAWFRQEKLSVPAELHALLESKSPFQGIKLLNGEPEKVTRLPQKGEGRNHDLALVGKVGDDRVTVCIEAKADEAFGNETVSEYYQRAMQRREAGIKTGVPERIVALLKMLRPAGVPSEATSWGAVRYQLLTAICGTILQAKRDSSSVAVFVVHEFHTCLTLKENLIRNHHEFQRFVQALKPEVVPVEPNYLYGPFQIEDIPCYVGKVIAP